MLLIAAICETAKKVKIVGGSRSTVNKRKSKKSKVSMQRAGYKDENGQTYLPPLKGAEAWKESMKEKGFTFGS